LLDKVDAMGATQDTIVIVTSDHGEMLGDHHLFGKKVPWEGAVRVPLVVKGPGIPKGQLVDTPVSTLSVITFILEKAGADAEHDWHSVPLPEPSESNDDPPVRSGLTARGNDFRLIVKKLNSSHTMKVVCCPGGCPAGNSYVPSRAPHPQVMAFNVAKDPKDSIDLRDSPEVLELVKLFPEAYAKVCLQDVVQKVIQNGLMTDGLEDPGADSATALRVIAGIAGTALALVTGLFILQCISSARNPPPGADVALDAPTPNRAEKSKLLSDMSPRSVLGSP